jgi:hypothetical protein
MSEGHEAVPYPGDRHRPIVREIDVDAKELEKELEMRYPHEPDRTHLDGEGRQASRFRLSFCTPKRHAQRHLGGP